MSNRDIGVEYTLREMAKMIIAKSKEDPSYGTLANASVEEIMEVLRNNTLPDFGIKIRKDRN